MTLDMLKPTCVGDLGLGGPGETGRSMWLELVSGLSGGLSSSGGDGVLASLSGPESLRRKQTERFLWLAGQCRVGLEDECLHSPWSSLDGEHFVRVLLSQFGHHFIQLSTHLDRWVQCKLFFYFREWSREAHPHTHNHSPKRSHGETLPPDSSHSCRCQCRIRRGCKTKTFVVGDSVALKLHWRQQQMKRGHSCL